MGHTPPDLAAPEIADILGVHLVTVEDWMERRLLPTKKGDDRVRRASQRNITILQQSRAIDAGRAWTEAEWEALLDRLGPVLNDPTSLRPSFFGRILDHISGNLS